MKRASVLGGPVTVAGLDAVAAAIIERARAGTPGYVCCANVHMVSLARRYPELMAAMDGAALVTSDGMPLVWHLRRQGWREAERVAGPDLMAELVARARRAGCPFICSAGLLRSVLGSQRP